MDDYFMSSVLVPLRERLGRPVVLTSAYRCPSYNSRVSKTGKYGPHTTGCAADIRCISSRERLQIVSTLLDLGVTRIGVSDSFIHADVASLRHPFPSKVMWTY